VKRKLDRLSRVSGGRRDADKGGDLIGWARRLGELHPLLDASVELRNRHILAGDHTGFVPMARKRVSKGKILTNDGVGVLLTCGRLEGGDRLAGAPGKGQCKAIVRDIEDLTVGAETRDRVTVLALSDLDERELERDLRLTREQGQRVLIGGLRGTEAPAGEIGIAEQGSEAGVVGRLGDRTLGELNCHRHIVRIECSQRASGEADIHVRFATEMRCRANPCLRRRAAHDHRRQDDERNC